MVLLTAMFLLLVGIFWYYRAIVLLREHLDEVQPEREAAHKFLSVEEVSLVSNPFWMYRFIFHGAVGALDDSEALRKARKKFISSFIICAIGAATAVMRILMS